jgi:TusA-related sulfurtransferase
MTGKSIGGLAFGVVATVLIATAIAYACGEQGCPLHQATAKDVKVEAKNLANGVVVTMTTDKPEVVKTLQAHFDKGGKGVADCGLSSASVEAKNLANGVVVTITTDKPDAVKTLQAHFANCGKDAHACGFAPGSDECKKAHESGSCSGHVAPEHGCSHGPEKK